MTDWPLAGARKGKDGFRHAVKNGEVNQKLAESTSFKAGNPEPRHSILEEAPTPGIEI